VDWLTGLLVIPAKAGIHFFFFFVIPAQAGIHFFLFFFFLF